MRRIIHIFQNYNSTYEPNEKWVKYGIMLHSRFFLEQKTTPCKVTWICHVESSLGHCVSVFSSFPFELMEVFEINTRYVFDIENECSFLYDGDSLDEILFIFENAKVNVLWIRFYWEFQLNRVSLKKSLELSVKFANLAT